LTDVAAPFELRRERAGERLSIDDVPAVVLRVLDRPRPLELVDAARARELRVAADAPTTPCARRRCAPSAAGRPKVRPHSGQVKELGVFFAAMSLLLM
jgi:hypothetical protein